MRKVVPEGVAEQTWDIQKRQNSNYVIKQLVTRTRPSHCSDMRVIFLLHLLPLSLAFQFPFTIPGIFKVYPSVPEPVTSPATHRIAIIGAGAGGTSAAFWLSKAKERFGLDIEVDIYEQSSYVGGRECFRTTTFSY